MRKWLVGRYTLPHRSLRESIPPLRACKGVSALVIPALIGVVSPFPLSPGGLALEFIGGKLAGNWFDSALQLLGDIVDPFLPGFAGSDLRPTSSKVTLAAINAQRRSAGLAPLGGRRRRKRALTKSDREDIGFIAGMISKAAARDFAMIVAGGR